ncbi:MAG: hypothetical protein GF307_00760 [candidate division Zixibacteria bacterium]|nr:hypothetical protein [candidate division Zixibacteria bacterium]
MREYKFSDFILIPTPCISFGDVELRYSDDFFEPAEGENAIIEKTWERLLAEDSGRILYDGPMVRLNSFYYDGGKFVMDMQRTSYKYLCGTNLRKPRAEDRYCADGIGICGAIKTADDKLLIGKRSRKVFEYPGYYHVVGGNMEPERHNNEEGIPDPFVAYMMEVAEETGISITGNDIKMTGYCRNLDNHKPEMLFYVNLEVASREIVMDEEHTELLYLEDSEKAICEFLSGNWSNTVPAGKAALAAYGMNSFGSERLNEVIEKFSSNNGGES